MSDNSYKKVKDYRLKSLDLILDSKEVVSLLDMYAEINIHQDLFGTPMSCSITISDALDLYSKLPIKNNDKLRLTFLSPGDTEITLNLSLYSRENISIPNDKRTSQYVLKFVSPEILFNATTKFSKAYTGKISDIVGAIWSELFTNSKPMKVEPTEDELTIILPINSPMTHISDLSKKAKREGSPDEVNYFFFQDFNNYNFASLGAMYQLPTKASFFFGPQDLLDTRSLSGLRSLIESVDIVGKENLLDEIVMGTYGGFISGHDIKTKSFGGLRYEYRDAFDKIHHCNQSPLATKEILERTGFLSNYGIGFSGGPFSPDLKIKRLSQIGSFLNKRIRFKVAGNSSINVGDKIHVDFTHQSNTISDDDGLNKYRSMDYIISSVKHTINKADGYTMTIEACSDSYAEPLPEISRFEVEEKQGASPR